MADRPFVENFGRNLSFRPVHQYRPRDEAEVLEILGRHRSSRLRAVGRLHSWSDAPSTDDVLLDLRLLNNVEISENNAPQAVVGAGCQIKRLLVELQNRGGWTIPSLGLITEQTIAGAAATATHGSGKNSLSHYVQALRIATYDPETGEPVVRVIDCGPELRAARCSLGCFGIVTAVTIEIRRQYNVLECIRRFELVEQVLDAEDEFPLQQFFLIPWRWDYLAQHRREVDRPRSWSRLAYRAFWSVYMDVGLHLVVRLLARLLPRFCTRAFYRRMLPALVPRGWKIVDRSDRQLTMQHELFRHIEIEMFVTRSRLSETLEYVVWLLRRLGGDAVEPGERIDEKLRAAGFRNEIEQRRGSYLHHYPICIRKVLPDEAMISTASDGDEPWYAVSFISYAHPRKRAGFIQFADILARTMAELFAARPHWGKHFPLGREDVNRLYAHLDDFRRLRKVADPEGRFLNAWTAGLLE